MDCLCAQTIGSMRRDCSYYLQGSLKEVFSQFGQSIEEREVGVGAEFERGQLLQDIQHPLVLHQDVVDAFGEDGALELVEEVLHAHVDPVYTLYRLHCTRED